ncbi:MAG TPA: biosynthetic peptidoglycan transglycosylase [Roseiarcus sp.]|nr:biosynthetic peptidoglycan transglycosylase [Roseiarcus sp.]
MSKRRSFFSALARGAAWLVLALVCLFVLLVALYAFVPPVSTLMLARLAEGKSYVRVYTPLNAIAPTVLAAVITSEDGSFCTNDGVDWGALREVLREEGKNGPRRGASTITMQVAKNLFLWPSRSRIRKAIEIGMALVLGKVWSKRRTIEIYLNIAEWGDGLFGVEAAAERYFDKHASQLSAGEAALLATALPNPIKRNPAHPRALQRRLAASLIARARVEGERVACLKR